MQGRKSHLLLNFKFSYFFFVLSHLFNFGLSIHMIILLDLLQVLRLRALPPILRLQSLQLLLGRVDLFLFKLLDLLFLHLLFQLSFKLPSLLPQLLLLLLDLYLYLSFHIHVLFPHFHYLLLHLFKLFLPVYVHFLSLLFHNFSSLLVDIGLGHCLLYFCHPHFGLPFLPLQGVYSAFQ
mmetsp:Transcript_1724/g.1635  ORF Transcript_1724/g.1635 Transcript_1724/m.1635 type:complete len:179 (-) Transcript_1724:373-909(-)